MLININSYTLLVRACAKRLYNTRVVHARTRVFVMFRSFFRARFAQSLDPISIPLSDTDPTRSRAWKVLHLQMTLC